MISLSLWGQNRVDESSSAVAFVYHRFGESKYPSTNITLEQFQTQLDYLQANDYNVWSLSQIIKHIEEKKRLPPKTVAITIDDAYYSLYANAYPMLKEKGYAFSAFVNTNAIDNGSKNYVTWDEMREMQKGGGEFFNHSLSHDYLLRKSTQTREETRKRVLKEILLAQKRIDEELGEKSVKMLAYPFGEYDLETKNILKKRNIIGVTQTSGPIGERSDFQAIKRFPMAEMFANMKGFETKLNTIEFPIIAVLPKTPLLQEQNPPTLIVELERPVANVSCFLSSGERVNIEWLSKTSFKAWASKPLQGERELYTCTAPAKNKKHYWYSHLFIVAKR